MDVASLPEDFRELGEGLVYFSEMLKEVRGLAQSIARGNLSCKLPKPDNELAAHLKSLHASLKHLTWQARQVADGDYNQRVEFMGDFASAFNQMIVQLKDRQDTLLGEIEVIRKQRRDLERSNNLFEIITGRLSEWIVMIDPETGERLFTNHPDGIALSSHTFESRIDDILLDYARKTGENDDHKIEEFSLTDNAVVQWFSITLYPLLWHGRDAVAAVVKDITVSKAEIEKLEEFAYQDALTGTYSRHYGMNLLDTWTEQHLHFVVCFIDMDMLKYVNDVFGHAEGDRYILQVTKLLQAFSMDACVCRLGGDEFMILATGITKEVAETRMETLRDTLIAKEFTTEDGNSYKGSISYGIVEAMEDNASSAGDLLSLADEKMYAYKRAHKTERRDAPADLPR
ncbi:MAG: diguanylate cyclase [Candidatus Accumulibacter sp.]|nr:diguanylate cyclase [Accumulibacter sp.]